MSKPKSEYSIQTVSNALRMLESFYADSELGVSELSRRLNLHKNNVFRLLATLEQSGYIEQNGDTDRYRLGTRCLELGAAFSRDHALMKSSRPILENLADSTNETAHIAVLRDHEVVHLDGVQADQMLICSLRVGQRLPVHCTALGKVLIGCAGSAGPERVLSLLDHASSGLISRTPATITDEQKLLDELGSVAAQGVARDLEECEVGMGCVAAPVFDGFGDLVAALSVSGPISRLSEAALHGEVGQWVLQAAEQLSQGLGYQV
ncbi:MAG: IclR family transcriptional regulator [Myxococcota bacterium]|nr:IclR family transcriptional regulator [Myxococcota bacterium]